VPIRAEGQVSRDRERNPQHGILTYEIQHKGQEHSEWLAQVTVTINESQERGIQEARLPLQIQCEATLLRARRSRDCILQHETYKC
jgi:hypothetical protein